MLNRDEDAETWERARQGDERAFVHLRSKYQRLVCAVIVRVAAHVDPDDLENEVWLAVWKGRHNFRGDATFKTWVVSIARNTTLEALRRERTHQQMVEHYIHQQAERKQPEEQRILEYLVVHDCLKKLETKLRDVILLHCWLQLTDGEIADRLSRPLGTVKSQIQTGKRQMCHCLRTGEETQE
jgi:RNA polymerase sigma-70 factor (ECF subfamily)